MAFFSSYGPMADGRIKPDIVTPGVLITSAGAKGGITGRDDFGSTHAGSSEGEMEGTE